MPCNFADASTANNYCILQNPTPHFNDPMFRVYICYMYKGVLCVSAHPRFLAHKFQVTMDAYSGDYSIARVINYKIEDTQGNRNET